MPRSSAGVYTAPSGQPVVSGTVVSATTHNTLVSDIATELTQSLDRSGKGAMQAPMRVPDGAVNAPTLAFANQTNTGLYRAGASDVRLAVNGADTLEVTASGVDTNGLPVTGSPTTAKAWGVLSLGAAGAVTIGTGHNIASASWSGISLTVVFTAALTTPYVVLAMAAVSDADDDYKLVRATTKNGASMVLTGQGIADALFNHIWASGMTVEVIVFGP